MQSHTDLCFNNSGARNQKRQLHRTFSSEYRAHLPHSFLHQELVNAICKCAPPHVVGTLKDRLGGLGVQGCVDVGDLCGEACSVSVCGASAIGEIWRRCKGGDIRLRVED